MKKRYGKKISKMEMICSCLVICGILFLTIGYSAFNTNMRIGDMNLTVRINADIRVTDVSIENTNTVNATSNYEDYNVKGISVGVNMPSADSSISYRVQITNIGNVEMGIFQLTNLPENIAYTIENYILQEPICVDSKCSLGIQKDIIITFKYKANGYNASNTTYNLNPIFDFRSFHNVTYKNIDNSTAYPSKVIDGGNLLANFPSDLSVTTLIDNTRLQSGVDYTLENGAFKLDSVTSDVFIFKDLYHYGLTGDYEVFTVPYSGYYLIELWGAQGGTKGDESPGGKGAYTRGEIFLNAGEILYIYVGGKGSSELIEEGYLGGYNGGGDGNSAQDRNGYQYGYSGGGATDIRIVNGNWNDFISLKSRIMVAAGGGGGGVSPISLGHTYGIGGAGGMLLGSDGSGTYTIANENYIGTGGTQTSAGYNPQAGVNGVNNGKFGFGGYNYFISSVSLGGAGGGGGYYGGGASDRGHGGGGGGSSFISGYDGCDAIAEGSTESNIIHTGQSNHYSGKVFLNPVMISGNANVPTYDGNGTIPGSTGDGHAKITYLPISSVKAYTATNLIKNGNFEAGNVDNWTVSDISTDIKYQGSYSMKIVATRDQGEKYSFYHGKVNVEYASDGAPIVFYLAQGDKYYCSAMYLSKLNDVEMLFFGEDWSTDTGGHFWVPFPLTDSTWNKISLYINYQGANNKKFWFRFDNNNNYNDSTAYYDNVMCINLTETFGRGNEPSKEWCDANIRDFDTTAALYK